jgi:hypothetical protein
VFSEDFISWFWSNVNMSAGADGCWYFQGQDRTYATVVYKRETYGSAHRIAYTIAVGEIPEGYLARHTCDNPPCCNPQHIIPGTHKDNTRDAIERGRHDPGGRKWNAAFLERQKKPPR